MKHYQGRTQGIGVTSLRFPREKKLYYKEYHISGYSVHCYSQGEGLTSAYIYSFL